MQISATNDFATDPERAFAMLNDPAFLEEVCLATQPVSHAVASQNGTTTVTREMPSPSQVRKFVGDTLIIHDSITWDPTPAVNGSRTGTASITVDGMPVVMNGTVTLVPGGRGAVLTYAGDLRVNIPFVGAKLEQAAAPALLDALEVQQQVADRYLAG